MLWFLFFVLAFGFGLGMWEFIAVRDAMERQGSGVLDLAKLAGIPTHMAYRGMPPALRWPVLRGWIFAGQLGFFIVGVAGWWTTSGFFAGLLRAIELEALYLIMGSAIGWGIWQAAGGSEPSS